MLKTTQRMTVSFLILRHYILNNGQSLIQISYSSPSCRKLLENDKKTQIVYILLSNKNKQNISSKVTCSIYSA